MSSWRGILLALVLLLVVSKAYSLVVVSNDLDWRSAYIIGYYAAMKGYGFIALDSKDSAMNVYPYILPKDEEIVVYESDHPIVRNYAAYLQAHGFSNVKTVKFSSAYRLMYTLPSDWGLKLNSAVLVSDAGGEWVLAAGPLAYAKRAYLLLVNDNTAADDVSFVKSKGIDPRNVVVVGYPGRSVKQGLPGATIVATGNRAGDAVKIAELLQRIHGYGQAYVMSGMFLYLPSKPSDPPLWTGAKGEYPILVAYPKKLPDVTLNFLKDNSNIRTIIFIGPELDKVWAQAREKLQGRRVLSLFAVGYVNVPTRQPGQAYPLPALFLPSGSVAIDVESARALPTGKIYITFRNKGQSAGYVMPTVIDVNCPGVSAVITNSKVFYVDALSSTTVEFDANKPLPAGTCTLSVSGVYGADKDNLNLDFNRTITVAVKGVNDRSSVVLQRLVYSPSSKAIIAYLKNNGPVPAYVTVYLPDVIVDGIPTSLQSRTVRISPGSERATFIRVTLSDADLLDNETVKYVLRFGERSDLPVHVKEGAIRLEKETLQDRIIQFAKENPLLVGAAVVLIILLLILFRKR